MAPSIKIYSEIDDVAEEAEKEEKKLIRDVRKTLLRQFSVVGPFVLSSLISRKIDIGSSRVSRIVSVGFDDALRVIIDTMRKDKITFTKKELSSITSLKSNILQSVKFPNDRLKQEVKNILVQNIGKGISINQLADGLAALPNTPGQIKTLANTSLQRFYRDTTYTKISATGKYFKYIGPVDSVTRPFCRYHAKKVWTKNQADEIHAKQQTFYNCRHDIRLISQTEYDSSKKFPVKLGLEG